MWEGPHVRELITTGGLFDVAITEVTFDVSNGVAPILFNTFTFSLNIFFSLHILIVRANRWLFLLKHYDQLYNTPTDCYTRGCAMALWYRGNRKTTIDN